MHSVSQSTLTLFVRLNTHNIGFCASLGSAGSAAFPFLTGAIASQVGVQVLPPIIMGLVIGMGVFWAMMPKRLMI